MKNKVYYIYKKLRNWFLSFASENKSFTIVETIVTVVIFSLLLGVISSLVVLGYRSYGYSLQQSRAIDEARKGIKTMIKEIREAKQGDDGSYPIEKAEDKEFIFFSDVDKDGDTERVRYFLGSVNSGKQTQECVTFLDGGFCDVTFSDFFTGTLSSALVKVSVEGDFSRTNEYAEIFADGVKIGEVCVSGCSDCNGTWEGTATFDVTEQALDNIIQFTADASGEVNAFCDWIDPNHSMKVEFKFSWTENLPGADHEFKRGVIEPTGVPVEYPSDQEKITTISYYVRNAPPIFKYFDANGQEITELPARLRDTKVMQVYLVINVDPNRAPQDFELKSLVHLRNLKEE